MTVKMGFLRDSVDEDGWAARPVKDRAPTLLCHGSKRVSCVALDLNDEAWSDHMQRQFRAIANHWLRSEERAVILASMGLRPDEE